MKTVYEPPVVSQPPPPPPRPGGENPCETDDQCGRHPSCQHYGFCRLADALKVALDTLAEP